MIHPAPQFSTSMAGSVPRPTQLNFITSNAGKLREARAALAGVPRLTLESRGDVDVPEIQGSVEEIARVKCTSAAAEVSSFEFGFLLLGRGVGS